MSHTLLTTFMQDWNEYGVEVGGIQDDDESAVHV